MRTFTEHAGALHQARHAQGTFTELRKGRVRLVGAVLTEQNDEWTEARRYMGPEILGAGKKGRNTTETKENDVTAEAIGARIASITRWHSHIPPPGTWPLD
jgi:hypothetical protein